METTAVQITNSENQEVTYDNHGLLCRNYDDVSETYDDEQLKIVNNILAITDDNWKTVKAAIGKIHYEDPENPGNMLSAYGVLGETLVGKLLLGEALGIYNDAGSLKFTQDGLVISNGESQFIVNPNTDKLFQILKGTEEILSVDKNGNGVFKGTIYASSGEFKGKVTADELIANTKGTIAGWSITADSLTTNVSETYPTMTSTDTERIRNIVLGIITPTQEDLNKYDFNNDGVITMYDGVCANKLVINYATYGHTKGLIKINSTSAKNTIELKATEGLHSGSRETKIGLNNISSATVSADSMFTNSLSVASLTLRPSGDYGQYSLYNGDFSIDGNNYKVVNGLITTGIIG